MSFLKGFAVGVVLPWCGWFGSIVEGNYEPSGPDMNMMLGVGIVCGFIGIAVDHYDNK